MEMSSSCVGRKQRQKMKERRQVDKDLAKERESPTSERQSRDRRLIWTFKDNAREIAAGWGFTASYKIQKVK